MAELPTNKLLTEVNRVNTPAKPLNLVNVSLQPAVFDQSDEHNTKVTIDAVPGRIYKGSVDVFYNRADLGEVLTDQAIRSTSPFTATSVIELINQQFGLSLTTDDFEPFTVPTPTLDQPQELTLVAKTTSMGYVNQGSLTVLYGRTLLSDVIRVVILQKLRHPINLATQLASARMTTWGQDFTSLRDFIKIDPKTGRYTDFKALQTACLYLGIPTWSLGAITDHATSAVPDSNPLFDRVVIQGTPGASALSGAIYLHYNLLDEV